MRISRPLLEINSEFKQNSRSSLENISVGDFENLSVYLTKTAEKFGRDITDYANAVDAYYSRKLFSL